MGKQCFKFLMKLLVLRTQITYLQHYVRESGKVPPWLHLFLDNTGSTNKNCYFMGWMMELVTEGVIDYITVSFMLAGHTKLLHIFKYSQ